MRACRDFEEFPPRCGGGESTGRREDRVLAAGGEEQRLRGSVVGTGLWAAAHAFDEGHEGGQVVTGQQLRHLQVDPGEVVGDGGSVFKVGAGIRYLKAFKRITVGNAAEHGPTDAAAESTGGLPADPSAEGIAHIGRLIDEVGVEDQVEVGDE